MTGQRPDSWENLLDALERLTGIDDPTAERCAEVLFSDDLSLLVAGLDVRMGSRSGVVVIDLAPGADLEGLARSLAELGPPIDMSIVSPPVFDPGRPDDGPEWEYKKGHCHLIGGRKVWFGLETREGVERMVHVAIHYEETDV